MENLKALVYKGDLTPYQMALAQREFKDLVERLELLEKAVKNNDVSKCYDRADMKYAYNADKDWQSFDKFIEEYDAPI